MKMKALESRRIHADDGIVYRVAVPPQEQRLRQYYLDQLAALGREERSLKLWLALLHVAYALPWVACVLWGFWVMQYNKDPGWPTLWRWALAFFFGCVHGCSVEMGRAGHTLFGAVQRARESIAARRAQLKAEARAELAALDAPRAADYFPA